MGRPARIDISDGWHHVMNRGAGRRDIYRHAGDARLFLDLLGQSHDRFGVEVHAYCLMPNHYHLLLRCPRGALSEFMHRVGSIYVRATNLDKGVDGPLFRDRFRSLWCASNAYVDNVHRYIHRNPLGVRPEAPLHEWRWSSYAAYLGRAARPHWLSTATVLEWHGGCAGYREFVEDAREVVPEDRPVERYWWAIQTAVAEYELSVTDVAPPKLERVVALMIADRVGVSTAAALFDVLQLQSRHARNMARHRARQRLADNPELATVVERAMQLAR